MPKRITGILMEIQATFAGSFPDIPVLETLVSELKDPDPVFVTLPIGKVGVQSRNGRTYPREAVATIVKAINDEKVVGQKGHLRDDERAYKFDIPPLTWVGATLEADGTAWGKAYVAQSAPDVREFIKTRKLVNGKVGTSIYGTADVDDDGTVSNLQIESIDLAHPGRLGVPMAGAVPIVTQEMVVEEAEADQLSVGDWVSWEDEGRLVRGRINTIWAEGEVEVPNSDSPAIPVKPDDAIARMDVFEPGDNGWRSWNQAVQYFSTLTKIDPLPTQETETNPSRTDNNSHKQTDDGGDMPTIQELEDKIAEMERKHKEALREQQSKLNDNRDQLADYAKVGELLGKPQDVVIAVQALQAECTDLKRENGELLKESIMTQVATAIKVESVRPTIEEMVRASKPARRIDIQTALADIVQREYIKTLLKHSVVEQMGPPQQPHTPTPDNPGKPMIWIPGVN